MLPIIVAVLLALSLVGGGVVYAAENAPSTSPLHPVQVAVYHTANTLHLAAPSATATPTPKPPADKNVGAVSVTASSQGKNSDQGQGDAAQPRDNDDTHPKATVTPLSSDEVNAVATAEAQITALAGDTAVPGHGGNGPENGLDAKLDAAVQALGRGDKAGAAAILDAFAHQLNAMGGAGHISSSDYSALYTQYTRVLALFNGSATPVPQVTPHTGGAANGKSDAHADQGKHDVGAGAVNVVPGTANGVATPTPTPGPHGRGNAAAGRGK